MTNQLRSNKIGALEPSKLSQSIKSRGGQQEKGTSNIVYETYYVNKVSPTLSPHQQLSKKTITQTQQIYGSQSGEATDQKFKKNKVYQVDKLNELKKQYQILRNIKIDDSFIYDQKVPKKQQSSAQPSQKSMHSIKSNHTSSKHKNYHLVQYEKKQLELMLANSMNKIQQLLKAEVEYKRKIYELNSVRLNPQVGNQKYEQKLKNIQASQKSNRQQVEKLRIQQEKLRAINFNLTQKIRSIQSENFNYQTQIRRMGQQCKRLQQNVIYQKQGHMNTKIQVKRFQLERDMIQRQKNNQVQRYKRTIKDLQEQISRLKDRYRQKQIQITSLNEKISSFSNELIKVQTIHTQQIEKNKQRQKQRQEQRLKERQSQSQKMKQLQKQRYQQIQKQKQKQNSYNFQKKLAEKITQLQRNQQIEVKRQLDILKQQIGNMKQLQQNSVDQIHLQIRIAALEKIITEDNQQKAHFLEQLRRIIKDFQDLEIQNQDLKQKLRKANKQLNNFRQSSAYELEKLQKSRQTIRASLNLEQVNNYLTKIRRLQAENKDLRGKVSKMEDSYSNTESRAEQKIRQYSRRLQQSQFQIEKLLKQNQFNLQIANAKYKAEIEIAKNDTARAVKQMNQYKVKYQQMKSLLQIKLQSFKRQKEQYTRANIQRIQAKDHQIEQIRNYADNVQARVRQQYEKQFFALLGRLDELIKSNQRYVVQNSRLVHSEGQVYELRQKIRKMVGLSDGIDHLWQIKETEYSNINYLLKQFKGQ